MKRRQAPQENISTNVAESVDTSTQYRFTTTITAERQGKLGNILIISIAIALVAALLLAIYIIVLTEKHRRREKWKKFASLSSFSSLSSVDCKDEKKMKGRFARKNRSKRKKKEKKRKTKKRKSKVLRKGSMPAVRIQKTQEDKTSAAEKKPTGSARQVGSARQIGPTDGTSKPKEEVNALVPMNVDDMIRAIKENKIALASTAEDFERDSQQKPGRS